MGVGGQHHAPAALYPRERPGTHCIGGWMGPGAGLDGCGKHPPPGFDLRTVQPVASRLTDWATPVPNLNLGTKFPSDCPTYTLYTRISSFPILQYTSFYSFSLSWVTFLTFEDRQLSYPVNDTELCISRVSISHSESSLFISQQGQKKNYKP